MGLSRIRADIPDFAADAPESDGAAFKTYEVFIQLERGKPHVYAGSIDAADDPMALMFAREHYGRDQKCAQIWVVPRDAILRTDYDKDLVYRLTDQSYRMAWGYNVGQKWREFRAAKDVEEYQKEDIKEYF